MSLRLVTLPGVVRPISDSRFLADVLREQTLPPRATALDLCTGSGVLAVTAALRGAREVTAVDASRRAVLSARLNARLNGVKVKVVRGDLYDAIGDHRFDAIVANPPYVPSASDELPHGRHVLDRIVAGAADHLRPGGFLLLTHSSLLGTERTIDDLERTGLDAECVARRRGPLGPRMPARVHTLEAEGLLPAGQRHEDVVIIRARKAARTSTWTSGASATSPPAPIVR